MNGRELYDFLKAGAMAAGDDWPHWDSLGEEEQQNHERSAELITEHFQEDK